MNNKNTLNKMTTQNSKAVAKMDKAPSGMEKLKSILDAPSVQQQFQNTLKEGKGTFVASIIDLYGADSKLQLCNPKDLVMECLRAAALKLPINKQLGYAYILPFNNSKKLPDGTWTKVMMPTFVIGYKGYIQLAMRTGQYRVINSGVAYEGEVQMVNKLSGEINFSGQKVSEKVVGYFGYFEMLNGFSKTLFVTVEDMAKHAKRYSPGLRSKKEVTIEKLIQLGTNPVEGTEVGWLDNFGDMAVKTCLRELFSKWGYMSIEMQQAYTGDNNTPDNESNHMLEANSNVVDIEATPYADNSEAGNSDPGQPQQPEPEPNTQQPPF